MLKKLVKICKKYLGEEETKKIIDETINEFRKDYDI